MNRTLLSALLASTALTLGCTDAATAPSRPELSPVRLASGVDGVIEYVALEGGFWAVRLLSGSLLDPHASLPEAFREDGRAVRLTAIPLNNVVCVHQAGTIVEITSIQSR